MQAINKNQTLNLLLIPLEVPKGPEKEDNCDLDSNTVQSSTQGFQNSDESEEKKETSSALSKKLDFDSPCSTNSPGELSFSFTNLILQKKRRHQSDNYNSTTLKLDPSTRNSQLGPPLLAKM